MQKTGVGWKLFHRLDLEKKLILFVGCLVLLSVPFYISNILIAGEKERVTDQLKAISQLKTETIKNWFATLEKDSLLIANDELLSTKMRQLFEGNSLSGTDRKLIFDRLSFIKNTYNFKDVILFDSNQSQVLTVAQGSNIVQQYDIKDELKASHIAVVDLHEHRNPADGTILSTEFHTFIPLSINSDSQPEVIGTLMIIIDPYEQVFPMVKAWPLRTKTGESLLVMRINNEITFPHTLRFANENESAVNFGPDDKSRLAVRAFSGNEEVIEAIDYRGKNVIAISSQIIQPNWMLITKLDLNEVYLALIDRLIQIALPTILLLTIIFGGFYSWRKNLSLAQQKLKESAKNRLQALNKHYSYLTKYANDIILLSDDRGVILEANDRALESYQYSREELIGKNIMDLENQKQDGVAREKLFSISNDGMMFETLHRRKDESILPVEINYRSILIRKTVYRQLIIRDITERRKSLSDLRRVERRFQLAVEASHTGLWDWNIISDNVWWSPELYSLLGYANGEVKPNNFKFTELLHPQDKREFRLKFVKYLKKSEPFRLEVRLRIKTGEYRWFKIKGAVKQDQRGKNIRMLGSLTNITERVENQQNSAIINRALKTLSASNEAVIFSRNEEELLANVSNVMVAEGGYLLSRIYYIDMENTTPFQMVMKASNNEEKSKYFNDKKFIRFLEKHDYTNEVIDKRTHFVSQDVLNDPGLAELKNQAFMEGYLAMMILPLINQKKVFGLLVIFSSSTFSFNEKEAALLAELANVLAHGINSLRMKEQQIKTQNQLLQSELRNRVAIEGTQQGIWELDFKNNQIVLDRTWMDIMGYETNQYTYDKTWWDSHIAPDSLREIQEALAQYMSGKTDFFAVDFEFRNKDGEIKWASSRGVTMETDESGRPQKMVGSHWEITEIRKLRDHHRQSVQLMELTLIETIKAISLTTEKRDPYTAGHQNRVSSLATAIAMEMKLDDNRIKGVELGSIIHDIGKIYIPSEILNRPGRISAPEFQLIKSHSQVGYDIVKGVSFPWPVAEMIHQHHERLDGSGYPQGLKGDEIILEAQILAVADVIEAVSSHRPYRPALGIEAGIKIIQDNKGNHFNPDIVDICVDLLQTGKFVFEQPLAA